MWEALAGSGFFAVMMWFPFTVEDYSGQCPTIKHQDICGLKGSSVDFPCSPKNAHIISNPGWSTRYDPNKTYIPLRKIPAYSSRMELGNYDCTLRLTDLKMSDSSRYYFIYSITNAAGDPLTCRGDPGVSLWVFESAVSIFVETPVRGQDGRTVMEGQRIILTCAPTCDMDLNPNPGFIWYKNKQQLNDSRAWSYFLILDPISGDDSGSYACVMLGYENLPSTAVNLRVQREQSYTGVNPTTLIKSNEPNGMHGCISTDQSNNDPTTENKSMILRILAASISVGLTFVILVTFGLFIFKQMRKKKGCVDSVHMPPDPNSDVYIGLDVSSLSPQYDTLNVAQHGSAVENVYENLPRPCMHMTLHSGFPTL